MMDAMILMNDHYSKIEGNICAALNLYDLNLHLGHLILNRPYFT